MRKIREEDDFWKQVSLLTSIGWSMALPIALGVLLGKLLDDLFHLGGKATLSLLLLGVLLAFFNFFRAAGGTND